MEIIKCIKKIYPDWRGVVWGNSYEGIKPHELETRPIPSLAELKAVWPQIEAERIAADEAETQRVTAKTKALVDNLPSWTEVDTAITNATNIAALKVIIRKMARVLYWLAKDKAD